MKKIILVFLNLTFAFTIKGQQPNFDWVKQINSNWHSFSYDIHLDTLGNIYTVGNFLGTTDFDPGPGTYTLTAAGSCDAYVAKMDPSGNLIWAVKIGDTDNDYAYKVRTDKNNNVYIGGVFNDTVDFDPGSGVYKMSSLNDESFILKLNSNGNFIWAKKLNGYNFSIDHQSNIIVSETFGGNYDFDPGPGIYNINGGYTSIGISKLDSSGNLLWAQAYATGTPPFYPEFYTLTTDIYGNTYSIGRFEGSFDFDPGAAVVTLSCSNTKDLFISKFRANGNFVWAKQFATTSNYNEMHSITVDKKCNVYSTGYFTHTADFDPGAGTHYLNSTTTLDPEIFVSKLDSSGNFVLAKSMGGPDLDYAQSISVDEFENMYISGSFRGTSDFDPGVGIYNLTAPWPANIFISKLNLQGDFSWAVSMGGYNSDYGYSNTVDKFGNIYTTGWFQDSVDFDPGITTFYLNAPGHWDGYVQKMSQSQVGINEFEKTEVINLFPNPTNDIIYIETTFLYKNFKVEVYNSLGSRVIEKTSAGKIAQINLSSLSNGIYFIKAISDDQLIKTQKVIKQ
ncbi:MAG: T9SS type A sorting domain-containing protein [Bacteroidia bacterium]|nr:T9SS type A sorting domain-containing protein [Bacteroidia bacterium]